ncbi:MAG: methionyl-tRNA formyltransferase [Anaerolineaceae bacterium]
MKNRIIFMGSPEFSVPSLEQMVNHQNVIGVVTQPDRPSGRGRLLASPPVKDLALSYGIPVIQPEKLKDQGVFETLLSWDPDFIVVVAFGQILRQNVLDLPRFGCINVHGSILPRWRGAAPIQASILHGDKETGITIMKMDKGIDTGDILAVKTIPIEINDNTYSLSKKLSVLGADLLNESINKLLLGEIELNKQDDSNATYAQMIKKEDGFLNPDKSADELERQIRAFFPWPGAFIDINGEKMKVLEASVTGQIDINPGERKILDGFPVLGTRNGGLKILKIQPAGRKAISGKDFLLGYKNWKSI